MSLAGMVGRLMLRVPRLDSVYASTLLNQAWDEVRREGDWSFQLEPGSLYVPGPITAGTVTLTPGSATVTGNAVAVAAWQSSPVFVATLQFRAGSSTGYGLIYDVIAADFTAGTLTLSLPWYPLGSTGTIPTTYGLYQPYIVAPCKDFRSWLSILDYSNGVSLDVRGDRRQYDWDDPQRQGGIYPVSVAGMGTDQRTGSATLGWERYEIWPNPQTQYSYQTWYKRDGADLVLPTDCLPSQMPEMAIEELAASYAYMWAESNKDPRYAPGAGADNRFLAEAAVANYKRVKDNARLRDRASVDTKTKLIREALDRGNYAYALPSGTLIGRTL